MIELAGAGQKPSRAIFSPREGFIKTKIPANVITFATSGNIYPIMTRPKAFIKANKIKCPGNHNIYVARDWVAGYNQ